MSSLKIKINLMLRNIFKVIFQICQTLTAKQVLTKIIIMLQTIKFSYSAISPYRGKRLIQTVGGVTLIF